MEIKGFPTGGRGIRIQNIAAGLRKHGHIVFISILKEYIDFFEKKYSTIISEEIKKFAHCYKYDAIIKTINPDVIIFSPCLLALNLTNKKIYNKIPIVIDMPGFLSLENLYDTHESEYELMMKKICALNKADAFCISNPEQKKYLYSLMILAGINIKKIPLLYVPISNDIDEAEEIHNYPDKPVFIFSGILWKWQNYGNSLETIADFCERKGGQFNIFSGNFLYKDETRNLNYYKKFSSVNLYGLTDCDNLFKQFRNASAAVEIYESNPEREFATTIRTMGFFKTGLPVIYSKNMFLSEFIKEYDAGWVVSADSEIELKKTLTEIFENPDICRIKGENAKKLLAEKFNNFDAVAELSGFCFQPIKLKKKATHYFYTANPLNEVLENMRKLKHESEFKNQIINFKEQEVQMKNNEIS